MHQYDSASDFNLKSSRRTQIVQPCRDAKVYFEVDGDNLHWSRTTVVDSSGGSGGGEVWKWFNDANLIAHVVAVGLWYNFAIC